MNSREKCATMNPATGATPIGGATAAANTTPESNSISNSLATIGNEYNIE